MQFDWDPPKGAANQAKHGTTFEQAITIWDDPAAMEGYDIGHSESEDRFIRIGLSDNGVLVVVYTQRSGDTIFIISARRASRREESLYYEYQTH